MDFATAFNWFEVVLWGTVGATFAVKAFLADRSHRAVLVVAAIGFAAFAGSDVVEIQTGAWWRPWWLFAWKSICVGVLTGLAINHYRNRPDSTDEADLTAGARDSPD